MLQFTSISVQNVITSLFHPVRHLCEIGIIGYGQFSEGTVTSDHQILISTSLKLSKKLSKKSAHEFIVINILMCAFVTVLHMYTN